MRILGLAILMSLSVNAAAGEPGVGERIRHTFKSSECENVQLEEIELREFQIRGDNKNFTRRHEHVAFCEVLVPGIPDYSPTVLLRDRSLTKVLQVNGARVRIALARKCFARETISNVQRDVQDPTLGATTKKAKEECLAKAKTVLDSNSDLKLDFDIQAAE